jgi:hypothetical protein
MPTFDFKKPSLKTFASLFVFAAICAVTPAIADEAKSEDIKLSAAVVPDGITPPLEQTVKPKYVVRVGTTVFVTGHFTKWESRVPFLNSTLVPSPKEEKTDLLVLVDTKSERQEATGMAELDIKYLKARGISVAAVGRCDLFCSRLMMGGKERYLAPGAYFDLQVPIDHEKKKLETRFPHTQFVVFEKNSEVAARQKDVYFEAFSEGGETGGLRVTASSAQFCKTRSELGGTDCKDYPLDSTKLGLTTSSLQIDFEIPEAITLASVLPTTTKTTLWIPPKGK